MPDNNFFANLIKNFGGNTMATQPSVTGDTNTGVMNYTAGQVKHPVWARITGKDAETEKLNQALQLIVAQNNAGLGGRKSDVNNTINLEKLRALIGHADKSGQIPSDNVIAGLQSEPYNKELSQKQQQAASTAQDAIKSRGETAQVQDTATKAGAVKDRTILNLENLIGLRARNRVDNDATVEKSLVDSFLGGMQKSNKMAIGPESSVFSIGSSGDFKPEAYGATEEHGVTPNPLNPMFPGTPFQRTIPARPARVGSDVATRVLGNSYGATNQFSSPDIGRAPDAYNPLTNIADLIRRGGGGVPVSQPSNPPLGSGIKPEEAAKKTEREYIGGSTIPKDIIQQLFKALQGAYPQEAFGGQ